MSKRILSYTTRLWFTLCCFVTGFIAVPALAQSPQKFDALRLENETTLDVPLEQSESLWSWLKESFKGGWQSDVATLATSSEIEQFVDTYFDVPERTLLSQAAGLRHRRRFFPNGEVKELIQLKESSNGAAGIVNEAAQTRGELKFELKDPTVFPGQEGHYDDERLLSLLKKSHIPLLAARLRELGVDINRVAPLVTLRQERRRVYFKENGEAAFTITLDLASSNKYWLKAKFAQLDIEINEIAFTKASPEERQRLLAVQQQLFARLLSAFPTLKRNQTPKVVMMVRTYEAQGLLARLVLRFGALLFLGAGLFLLAVVIFLFGKRAARRSCV